MQYFWLEILKIWVAITQGSKFEIFIFFETGNMEDQISTISRTVIQSMDCSNITAKVPLRECFHLTMKEMHHPLVTCYRCRWGLYIWNILVSKIWRTFYVVIHAWNEGHFLQKLNGVAGLSADNFLINYFPSLCLLWDGHRYLDFMYLQSELPTTSRLDTTWPWISQSVLSRVTKVHVEVPLP